MNNQNIQTKLLAPFGDSDIEWRLQWTDKENTCGIAVPYVSNRAIQARLDEVVGIENWKNEYIPWHSAVYSDSNKQTKRQVDSQICGISIYFEDKKEWITKYDGAEDSEIEPIKGGLSDSMKRAAVHWGIGRYLYSMDSVFVDVELNKKGKPDFKKGQRSKLDTAHQACVKKIFGGGATEPEPDIKPTAAHNAATSTVTQIPREGAYCVVSTAVHPSAKHGYYTNLQLRDTGGNIIQALMPGKNDALIPEAWIVDAKISKKIKDDIVFYSLEGFEFAAPQNQAA